MSHFADDETPTRPDASGNPSALMIARLYDQLAPIEQRRLARLVEAWFTAHPESRILIEEVAFRLPKKSEH